MHHWLLKSEPDVFSFDHLKQRPKKTEPWNGVRNYQVRNMMRDQMSIGDLGFFYHSSCDVPGIAGIVKIVKEAYPDHTQFDPSSEYFDKGSKREDPRWLMVDVKWEADFKTFVTLDMLRADPNLADMLILRRGNRLSITQVETKHWDRICKLGCL
jgi:predicted RNA-binding protein with PUA-like domain